MRNPGRWISKAILAGISFSPGFTRYIPIRGYDGLADVPPRKERLK